MDMMGYDDLDRGGPMDSENALNLFLTKKPTGGGFDDLILSRAFFDILKKTQARKKLKT